MTLILKTQLLDSPVSAEQTKVCREENIDLIVVGTRGKTDLKKTLLEKRSFRTSYYLCDASCAGYQISTIRNRLRVTVEQTKSNGNNVYK
jgi:hypothetical protein